MGAHDEFPQAPLRVPIEEAVAAFRGCGRGHWPRRKRIAPESRKMGWFKLEKKFFRVLRAGRQPKEKYKGNCLGCAFQFGSLLCRGKPAEGSAKSAFPLPFVAGAPSMCSHD